jgi:acyl-CoA dehydrogenase
MLMRINDPKKKPFGKNLREHGVILEWVAKARTEIDAARLVVCNAAITIDELGAKGALTEIAEAKVFVPRVTLKVIDKAVQAFGGAGVSQDTPLANMWANSRTLRIVDGPDEVHLRQMGRNENKKGGAAAAANINKQQEISKQLFAQYNIQPSQIGDQIKNQRSRL